jgi:GT2 family glycosyltransferase
MSIPLIGVLCLVRYDLLLRLINSIDYSVDNLVILFQGGYQNNFDFNKIQNKFIKKIHVISSNYNVGVSRGWNYILKNFDVPYYIISGDDNYFESKTLEKIYNFMNSKESNIIDYVFWSFNMKQYNNINDTNTNDTNTNDTNDTNINDIVSSGFSTFLLTKTGVKTIGYFDENIYPAYYEDLDYWRRISLSDKPNGIINNATIISGDKKLAGSCSLNAVSIEYRKKMDECIARNKEYYISKWNNDSYNFPFNKSCYSFMDEIPHDNYKVNQCILLQHIDKPIYFVETIIMDNLILFDWTKYFKNSNKDNMLSDNIEDVNNAIDNTGNDNIVNDTIIIDK